MFTHGETVGKRDGTSPPPEYLTWAKLKRRCENPSDPKWDYYGGRGIGLCKRWYKYENFLADMGRKPTRAHTLERKNNNKGYNPKNCCWATRKDQARNRRSSRIVKYQGRMMSLAEACELANVNYDAAKYRLNVGKPFDASIHPGKSWRKGNAP